MFCRIVTRTPMLTTILILLSIPLMSSTQSKTNVAIPAPAPRGKQSHHNALRNPACGMVLPPRCSCFVSDAKLSVSCYKSKLRYIPELEYTSRIIRTLNLANNKITKISIGDFYGLKIERLLLSNNSLSELDFLSLWGLEYHLENLDLSFNDFTSVPADALRLLRNLRSLTLTGNKISRLRDNEFNYLTNLEVLYLSNNPIVTISTHAFRGTNLFLLFLERIKLQGGLDNFPVNDLRFLKGLYLNANGIKVIPKGWLSGFAALKILSLNTNRLGRFDVDTFAPVSHSLRTLHLHDNKFKRVPRLALRLLPYLETLRLSRNRIKKIHSKAFNYSKSLETLDLSHNNIVDVSEMAFVGLDNIKKIDLRDNLISILYEHTFNWESFVDKQVYLSQNPWLCNGIIKWFKRAFKNRTNESAIFTDAFDMKCERPHKLEGKHVLKVRIRDFTCDNNYYYYTDENDMYIIDDCF